MSEDRYPIETLGEEDDDGTMPANVAELEKAIVGHRIVSADREPTTAGWRGQVDALTLTLDDGTKVRLMDTDDCCAYTELQEFFAHPEMVDHAITAVGTTDGYTKWHIVADFGDIMTLKVGWSPGNPFYYGYGFHIAVEPAEGEAA